MGEREGERGDDACGGLWAREWKPGAQALGGGKGPEQPLQLPPLLSAAEGRAREAAGVGGKGAMRV